jgi:hypothetical protein
LAKAQRGRGAEAHTTVQQNGGEKKASPPVRKIREAERVGERKGGRERGKVGERERGR